MYSAQVLGNKMASAWTESFNFCRRTDGDFHSPEALKEQPMAIPTLPPRAAPAGQLRGAVAAPLELPPSHHSYFSTAPLAAFNFTLAHTSGVEYNMSSVWQSSHEYSDGRCAILRWVQFPGYQIHFVDQRNGTAAEQLQYLPQHMHLLLQFVHLGAHQLLARFFAGVLESITRRPLQLGHRSFR